MCISSCSTARVSKNQYKKYALGIFRTSYWLIAAPDVSVNNDTNQRPPSCHSGSWTEEPHPSLCQIRFIAATYSGFALALPRADNKPSKSARIIRPPTSFIQAHRVQTVNRIYSLLYEASLRLQASAAFFNVPRKAIII